MKLKKFFTFFILSLFATTGMAQGWPSNYQGVILQGFWWDSFSQSQWTNLEAQSDILSEYFSLVWLPQSGNCGGNQSMGYDDLYWLSNYNSSFGSEKELRSLINTLKSKGTGTIADVVINHRRTLTNWVDFPKETYKGKEYQLLSTDICANDDSGATKKWADNNGFQLSSNNDTGEGWDGFRDLDHNSQNVQENVHVYLDFLLNDLGYTGFRYDMVKGYAPQFTALYNSAAKPQFSVGEYWDGNVSAVKSWIDGTKVDGAVQSAAFDFPFRYSVRDAANNGDWTKLSNKNNTLATTSGYERYSVTFVENHDTQYRSADNQQDPIRKDTLAANAYLLSMPGTPCVFLRHWFDCKREIAKMIKIRNLMGIHNESRVVEFGSKKTYHAHAVYGEKGNLLCVVGTEADTYEPTGNWYLAAKGYHWAYYTSTPVEIGEITFPEDNFQKYDITVHVNVEDVGWQDVNFWTWGGDGSHEPANNKWPGDKVTANKTIDGKIWYYKSFTINSDIDCVNFVFSSDNGNVQTVDINNVKQDAYFKVLTSKSGTKHEVKDVTEAAAVEGIVTDAPASSTCTVYNLQGQRVGSTYKGIVVRNGRKYLTMHKRY